MSSNILPVAETSDMSLVTYLPQIIRSNDMTSAKELFASYKFWYHEGMMETGQVFWSENHYIMNCSSELLIREMLNEEIPPALLRRISVFLRLKVDHGFAEFFSPVYLPFTIASILNLYDFSKNKEIKELSQKALDRVSFQIASATLPDGSMITPSGRSYARHRITTTKLHIHQFVDFLINRGLQVTNEPLTALRATLPFTSYRPPETAYRYLKSKGPREFEFSLSPSLKELITFLDKEASDDPSVYVSNLWSHGAYLPLHVSPIQIILSFMDAQSLWKHPHFKALSVARTVLKIMSTSMATVLLFALASLYIVNDYARGGLLTGARVRIYREGSVVLASLVNYNQGLPSFQQWPWTLNLGGIPIWCSYGSVGSAGLSKLGNSDAGHELSTARVQPYIRQEGKRLTALYRSSSLILQIVNMNIAPLMRWPTESFDQHGESDIEGVTKVYWALKNTAACAYTIKGNLVNLWVCDLSSSGTTMEEFLALVTSTSLSWGTS